MWVVDRIPHAGLGRKVGDVGEPVLFKELLQQLEVADVAVDHARAMSKELVCASLLESHIVVAVEVVQHNHLVAKFDQGGSQVEANEASTTGHLFSAHFGEGRRK